jgi:hypothetical protein
VKRLVHYLQTLDNLDEKHCVRCSTLLIVMLCSGGWVLCQNVGARLHVEEDF